MDKRALPVGSELVLSSDGHTETFVIEKVMGVGGSCVAYKVSYEHVDTFGDPETGAEVDITVHPGILKEFCPAFLTESSEFKRSAPQISVPEADREKFSSELRDFRESYKLINKYLRQNEAAINYHSIQLGLYYGNGTAYTLSPYEEGVNFGECTELELPMLLEIMLSVAEAIELYHDAGLLHLDIKPGNFFLPTDDDGEIMGIVRQFDYDSLVPVSRIKNAIQNGGEDAPELPITGIYEVPELERQSLCEVDFRTDVFEIGAMLYICLMGENPSFGGFNHDREIDLGACERLKGASPALIHELKSFFRKTVSITRCDRYGSVAEVKAHLERLLELSDRPAMCIAGMPKWIPSVYFAGRKREVQEIDRCLDTYGYVFVKGMGGIGKTELAKKYADKYGDKYHTVLFCEYEGSLERLVYELCIDGFDETKYGVPRVTDKSAPVNEAVLKEKNALLHDSDGHTLIVVDNFNKTHDDFMRFFLPEDNRSFKVIFTTRCAYANKAYLEDRLVEPDGLSAEECRRLFCRISRLPAGDPCVDDIIGEVRRNPLATELLAKAVARSGDSAGSVLEKLRAGRLADMHTVVYHEYDFTKKNVNEYGTVSEHLKTVFDVSGLSAKMRGILDFTADAPSAGTNIKQLCEACGAAPYFVYDLADAGWLEVDADRVSMHPVVAAAISAHNDAIEE